MPPKTWLPKVRRPSSCISPEAGIDKKSTHETDIPSATIRSANNAFMPLPSDTHSISIRLPNYLAAGVGQCFRGAQVVNVDVVGLS